MGNGALAIGPKLPRPSSTLPEPTSEIGALSRICIFSGATERFTGPTTIMSWRLLWARHWRVGHHVVSRRRSGALTATLLPLSRHHKGPVLTCCWLDPVACCRAFAPRCRTVGRTPGTPVECCRCIVSLHGAMIGRGSRSYAKCLFHEDLPEIQ